MTGTRTHLLVFARYPVAGRAKTRLIPALGASGAAGLHRRLTEYAVEVALAAGTPGSGWQTTVACTGAATRHFRAWLGPGPDYARQSGGTLGDRLHAGFAAAFGRGADRALAIGTDAPTVTADVLREAAESLAQADVVLGPAEDGGYYLIGMRRPRPELFAGIDWGTNTVAESTRAAIRRAGLTRRELRQLADVDRPDDLPPLRRDPRFADVFTGKPRLSIIIPTLNEGACLGAVLVRAMCADHAETLVADGGSRDATRDIAAAAGATVLETAPGRAAQQNAGAEAASGRHLLFLHADTLLPEGFAERIRQTLEQPSTVLGAFRFKLDDVSWQARLVEWNTAVRCALFRLPYGDQGLFLEKRVFDREGGFADLPLMEDFDLVRRLRRRGGVALLREPAVTSARRWHRLGFLRTTWRNQLVIAGFLAGADPQRLARFYRGERNTIP